MCWISFDPSIRVEYSHGCNISQFAIAARGDIGDCAVAVIAAKHIAVIVNNMLVLIMLFVLGI